LDQVDDEGHSPLIRTGPTGTNVADVCVILIK
jgi:glycerate-2-kinase